MKKVLIVILVLLLLCGLGVGGYFLYVNVLADMISGSNVEDDGTYHISTDVRFTAQMDELKEVVGKKEFKEVAASLDAAVNDFINYQPIDCYDKMIESLYMPNYSEVQSINLDLSYVGTEQTYVICTYQDGYYAIDDVVMMNLETILYNNIFGDEEETQDMSGLETIADESSAESMPDMFEQQTVEASSDLLEMINKADSAVIEELDVVEDAKDKYKQALNDDSKYNIVSDYIDGLINNTSNPECVVVGLFNEETSTLTIYYRYNEYLFNVFDIDVSGNMNDYSQVFLNEVVYTPVPWYEYYNNLTGQYGQQQSYGDSFPAYESGVVSDETQTESDLGSSVESESDASQGAEESSSASIDDF